MFDVVISGGTVIDPAAGRDGRFDVGIRDGAVAAVEPTLPTDGARDIIDASGLIVTPGLVDVHTHLYWGVSHYGIEADTHCLAKGVTTAVDAGSSGAQTFPGFRRYVIEAASTRVLAFENLSVLGMVSPLAGELEDLRYVDLEAATAVAEQNRDVIVGIKVRVDGKVVGKSSLVALQLGRELADRLGLPMMVHILGVPDPLSEILALLNAGDLVTHCFHGGWNGVLDNDGKLLPSVTAAAERGVLFDVGHGAGSFSFEVARRCLEQGFVPHTISSDLHAHNVNGPVYDLATTLSKFLYLGLSLPQVIEMATSRPAVAIGWEGRIGTLAIGATADIALFEVEQGAFSLMDSTERNVRAQQRLTPRHVIRAARLVQN